jgi:hypothetical protein
MVAIANNIPTLYSVDVATGQRTTIKSPLGDGTPINEIGYNSIDNKLYGVQASNPPTIIQIGARGEIVAVQSLPVAAGAWNVGDVDENGHFWISYAGGSWTQVDLSTKTILASGTASIPLGIYDWAFVPGGGNFLYAIAVNSTGNTFLYRFNRVTKSWAQVGTGYGAIYPQNGVVGAAYASLDGFLYGSENSGGKIYRFSLDGRTAVLVATGPTASSNDGAHCIFNSAT